MYNSETKEFDLGLDKLNTDRVTDPYLKKLNAEAPATPPSAPGLSVAPMASTNRAYPEPPADYMPGPTSAIKMFDEDSLAYKIGTTLQSMHSSNAGKPPMHFQLKMAQMEADRKQQETKLGWDNFYASAAKATQVMQKQNQDAMRAGLEAVPKLKYQVAAITDPEERKTYAKSAASWLEAVSPGMGKHIMKFADNPSLGYAMDGLADDPDYGDEFKEIIARVGVPEAYSHPQWMKVASARNHDMMNSIVLHHFNDAASAKLHSGKMTEDEFREAHAEASKDAFVRGRIKQRDMLGMKLYLTSEEGVQQMAGNGVQTNKAALAHQIKQKEMTPKERANQERDELINDPERFKKLPTAEQKKILEDRDIAQGLTAPRSNPSDTPNNPLNQRIDVHFGGKYKTLADIDALPDGAEKTKAYKEVSQLQKEMDAAKAFAGASAQEEKSADLSDVYDLREFRKSGRLVPMMGDVSVKELRSSKDMRKLHPKVVEEVKTYNVLNENYANIFADAKKAYREDASWADKKGRTGAEALIQAAAADPQSLVKAELAASATEAYPELATYLSSRESVLGKFARSVSGEVGVLTDQDAGRVRGLFPRSGDTAAVIRAKEKAMKRLMDLNNKFMRETIAGVDPYALRNSDEYKSTVNGIFGSIKGLKGTTQESTKTGVDALGDELAGK